MLIKTLNPRRIFHTFLTFITNLNLINQSDEMKSEKKWGILGLGYCGKSEVLSP